MVRLPFRWLLPLLAIIVVANRWSLVNAQNSGIDEAARAVVRILAQRCTLTTCQRIGEGSGAIIHPSGIILTAWHVTIENPDDPLHPRYADDFLIEMTDDVRRDPQPRYHAELIAFDSKMDLALLRIYQEYATNRPMTASSSERLPTLPISDEIPSYGQLQILGYSPSGGNSIKYPIFDISGFYEQGTIITVQGILSKGYSGGPALLLNENHYEIVGVVIRRRGDLDEIGLIRSIDQLHNLTWLPQARRAWVEDARVAVEAGAEEAQLSIRANLQAIDLAGRDTHLLAYLFDSTGQPWPYGELVHSANHQPAILRPLTIEHFLTLNQPIEISVPLSTLGATEDDLRLRIVLWDRKEARVLWEGGHWFVPEIPAEIALAPNATVTLAPTVTPIPPATSTATATPIVTDTPTPTNTATSLPLPAATVTIRHVVAEKGVRSLSEGLLLMEVSDVSLLSPADGATIEEKMSFEWTATSPLPEGYVFEPVFWREGEDPLRDGLGYVGLTSETILRVTSEIFRASGMEEEEYYWGILLVKENPYERIRYLGGSHLISVKLSSPSSN